MRILFALALLTTACHPRIPYSVAADAAIAPYAVRRRPPSADSVALPCELDAWPGATTRRIAPRYPEILRQAGLSGTVDIRYEIDTTGHVVLRSFRVFTTAHVLFAQAVRSALQDVRFATPRRNGIPVRVRVEESFRFEASGNGIGQLFARPQTTQALDSAGVLHTTVASYFARDTTVPPLSNEDTWSIYHAVAEHLMRAPRETPSAYCVVAGGMQPPAAVFARWRAAGRRVVPLAECPRTYASMVVPADETDRPAAGWVDPIRIRLLDLEPWTREVVILEARVAQGTGTNHCTCGVRRQVDGWGEVKCVATAYSVS